MQDLVKIVFHDALEGNRGQTRCSSDAQVLNFSKITHTVKDQERQQEKEKAL